MINYYLLSKINKKIVPKLLDFTEPLESIYPDYRKWFINTHLPFIGINRETIIAISNSEIVGIINIKYSDEKKICTIYIKEEYRHKNIGSTLLDMAFNILETSKPIISISDSVLKEFSDIIINNDWELVQELVDYYKQGKKEYVYNGKLKKKEL